MRAWIISALVLLGLAGCAENTAGMRVDGETQHVFSTTMYWVVDYWSMTSPRRKWMIAPVRLCV